MKIILFNGPPHSGKDTAARLLTRHFAPVAIERFSMPIKRAFASFMDAPIDALGNVHGYEDHKDTPMNDFTKRPTYREWQIAFSEQLNKPLFGDDVFTRLLIRRLERRSPGTTMLIPDCGFQIECDTLRAVSHMDLHIQLLRVHRAGCDFSLDSRSYLFDPSAIDIHNDSTREVYEQDLLRALQ